MIRANYLKTSRTFNDIIGPGYSHRCTPAKVSLENADTKFKKELPQSRALYLGIGDHAVCIRRSDGVALAKKEGSLSYLLRKPKSQEKWCESQNHKAALSPRFHNRPDQTCRYPCSQGQNRAFDVAVTDDGTRRKSLGNHHNRAYRSADVA